MAYVRDTSFWPRKYTFSHTQFSEIENKYNNEYTQLRLNQSQISNQHRYVTRIPSWSIEMS